MVGTASQKAYDRTKTGDGLIMFKMSRKALVDAFTGFGNKRARDVADSMGNRTADAYSISLVQQTLSHQEHTKPTGIRGFFELAAHAWKPNKSGNGTTGRPYKPTFAFAAPEPR